MTKIVFIFLFQWFVCSEQFAEPTYGSCSCHLQEEHSSASTSLGYSHLNRNEDKKDCLVLKSGPCSSVGLTSSSDMEDELELVQIPPRQHKAGKPFYSYLWKGVYSLFDTKGFVPRWTCGEWSNFHGWLHVFADLATFLAYISIPSALLVLIRRRKDIVFPKIFWLFAAFIFSCGTVHLLEAIIYWHPLYRLSGLIKLITAIVSLCTLFAFIRVLPKILHLPGLTEVNQQLNRVLAELDRSNKDLESFAYIASHDIKEPIRGINNFAHFLLEDYKDRLDPEGSEKLEAIIQMTERMDKMVSSLLHYSRVGQAKIQRETVDINQIVKEAIHSTQLLYQERGVQLLVLPNLPMAYCDPSMTLEIFTNLISNAAKYSKPNHSWVEIGAFQQLISTGSYEQVFYVKDNGIGISEQHFETIFHMFKRLHGQKDYGGGFGLGLAIAKQLVERHEGRIWVESEVDVGTTFYFTLAKEVMHETTQETYYAG